MRGGGSWAWDLLGIEAGLFIGEKEEGGWSATCAAGERSGAAGTEEGYDDDDDDHDHGVEVSLNYTSPYSSSPPAHRQQKYLLLPPSSPLTVIKITSDPAGTGP